LGVADGNVDIHGFFDTYKTFNEKNVQRHNIFTLSVKGWLVSDAYFEFTKIFGLHFSDLGAGPRWKCW